MVTTQHVRKGMPASVVKSAAALGMALAFLPISVSAQSESAAYQPAEWEKIVAAAKKEGRVVVYYTPVTPVILRLKADFEAAFPGIVLEHSRAISGTVAKIEAERKLGADGGDAHLDSSSITWTRELAKSGALKPPAGPESRRWPAAHLLDGVVLVLGMEPITIAYNTNLVKTPINGYPDLLRAEFKGKIATTEILSPTSVAWYEWLEKTQGADFLQKLADLSPRYFTGVAPSTQAAVSGEMTVAAYSIPTTALPLIAQGAPIRMVLPNPSFGIRYTGAVFAWAKRPNAALVFLDYLMSPRGQATWHGKGETASPLLNIPGALDSRTVHAYDPAPYTPEVVKAYTAKWNAMFKR